MFFFLFRGHVGIGIEELVDHILQQFVGAEALPAHGVFDHEIGESIHVSGGFEDHLRSEAGAFHLEHGFGQYKVFAPRVDHGGFEGASGRAQVEETLDSAVDFEAGDDEHFAQDQFVEYFAVEGFGGVGGLLVLP